MMADILAGGCDFLVRLRRVDLPLFC